MNWEEACQILGVPITATHAEIQAQYIYKAQLLHPDKTVNLPEKVRQKAEEELKQINAAYTVLEKLKNNPLANPPKLSVFPKHIRFKDVELGQTKTTVIEIESIGGAYTKFWMDDAPATWLEVIEVKSTTKDPLPLVVTIEATGSSTLRKQNECNLRIRIENEKTKAKDEVSLKIELFTKTVGRPDIFTIFGIPVKNPFTKPVTQSPPQPVARPTAQPPRPIPPHRPHRGRKIFVIADTHFDHTNIIRYCHRPFPNVQAMNRALVDNWNRTVDSHDRVYFLGDLTFGRGSRGPGH
jgi:hypothetical protein